MLTYPPQASSLGFLPIPIVDVSSQETGKNAYSEMRQTALEQNLRLTYTKGMNGQTPFLIFFSDGETVIRQVTQTLTAAGLRVVRSFDLRSACAPFDQVCPHHGTVACDCQLVVLLVYGVGTTPVVLVLHSHMGQTELQWDETPEARPSPEQKDFILQAMTGKAVPQAEAPLEGALV